MGTTYQQTEVITQAPQKKDHSLAYGAGGAVAGLAAGALLMHEGHKVGMSIQSLAGCMLASNGLWLMVSIHDRGALGKRQGKI